MKREREGEGERYLAYKQEGDMKPTAINLS